MSDPACIEEPKNDKLLKSLELKTGNNSEHKYSVVWRKINEKWNDYGSFILIPI